MFYWTHLLYIPFWALLIIHAPHFWIWFAVPGLAFIIEKIYRFARQWTGHAKTYIKMAQVFPSRVTHLVIKKPTNFEFHPGDYVFVKIKSIASFEWHPFTVSSAPELPGTVPTFLTDFSLFDEIIFHFFIPDIWLHIRCAGGWTTKLYDHYRQLLAEKEKSKSVSNHSSNNSVRRRLQSENNQDVTIRHKRLRKISVNSQQMVGIVSNRVPVQEAKSFSNASHNNQANGKNISTPRVIFAPETLVEKV